MAIRTHGCNAACIAQCSMSRATPEATGCPHHANTCSISWWPPGQQQTKQLWNIAPTLLAIWMSIAVRRCHTVCITWWGRFMAFLEATGRHHWASICSNNIGLTYQCQFLWNLSLSTCWKRPQGKRMAPTNNRGMKYQTNEMHLTNVTEYFVRVVKLACYCSNNCVLLCIIYYQSP